MDADAQDRAFMLISGFPVTQMVRAVTELKIPDLVADGLRNADDLAASTGVRAEPLRRVLRCLAAAGVFAETEDGRFGATPVSECYRDLPGSLGGMARRNESYEAFGALMHTLHGRAGLRARLRDVALGAAGPRSGEGGDLQRRHAVRHRAGA